MSAPAPLSRRSAVLGAVGTALGAVVLAGCDTDDLKPHDAAPTAATTPTASPGQPTADEQLVDGVAAQILTAMGTVIAARHVRPLASMLAPVLKTHRAHLAALHQQGTPPRVVGPKGAGAALHTVLVAESALRAQLVDAAVGAESGTLAVLLASMSASITQLQAGPTAFYLGLPPEAT